MEIFGPRGMHKNMSSIYKNVILIVFPRSLFSASCFRTKSEIYSVNLPVCVAANDIKAIFKDCCRDLGR